MDRDFYSVLNISRDASKKEIRKAYLRLARQYHPDLSQEPNARKQFEDINEAYTILFDDESRTLYNHYFEERDEEPPPWWWQYTAVASIGLGVCAVLAYGLALYIPTLEQELYTLATIVESKKADVELLQIEVTQALFAAKDALPAPETTTQQPLIADEPPKTERVEPPSQNDLMLSMAKPPKEVEEVISPLEQATVPPPILKPSARNYELLAFYSLVIGDLTQFRNAIKLAYQEDPSFSKLNALNLSLQQLESAKLPPESMLHVLRSLVLHEYSERLLPSQLRALKAHIQNDGV
jgi:curved DNA-binding protein CbpA